MKSGDPCPCGGRFVVRTSEPEAEWQKQYLRCKKCGAKATARVHESAVFRRGPTSPSAA